MGAGSRADPPPRMQKRWQKHQDRRKGGQEESKAVQRLSLSSSLTSEQWEGRGGWGTMLISLENSVVFTNGF